MSAITRRKRSDRQTVATPGNNVIDVKTYGKDGENGWSFVVPGSCVVIEQRGRLRTVIRVIPDEAFRKGRYPLE